MSVITHQNSGFIFPLSRSISLLFGVVERIVLPSKQAIKFGKYGFVYFGCIYGCSAALP